MPRLWKVRTVTSRAMAAPRRCSIRSSISWRASRAKASSNSSDGLRYLLRTSHPVLATMTDVLPLPAAATTRLRRSSITTARRCSSVSGRTSIRSKNSRERTSSLSTNAWFAVAPAAAGASRNSRVSRSMRTSGTFDNASGQRAASPPAAVRASSLRSRNASAVRYLGGSANSAMRSWTVRSAPVRDSTARRHHSRLAVSMASARTFASARDSPDTRPSPVAWRIETAE